jgi:hypothetical protein
VLKAAVSNAGKAHILRQRGGGGGSGDHPQHEDHYAAAGGDFVRRPQGGGGAPQQRGVDEEVLYLTGLAAMLAEMRAQRPADTPFGHTQQLQPRFPRGAKVGKAQRLAAGRARPPLAAAPSVWARRREAPAGLEHAPWPRAAHAAAAALERAFWARVPLRPLIQPGGAKGAAAAASGAEPVRGLTVNADLGCVNVAVAAPNGRFLAVGTSRGAVLVWDLREDRPAAAWFQADGGGQAAAGWNPFRGRAAIKRGVTGEEGGVSGQSSTNPVCCVLPGNGWPLSRWQMTNYPFAKKHRSCVERRQLPAPVAGCWQLRKPVADAPGKR